MTEANPTPLEREYSPSSCVEDIGVYIRQYVQRSAKMRQLLANNLHENVAYGSAPRTNMDIFVPDGKGPFPVHVFIHGGYWQELSKRESAFAAANFLDHNVIFMVLDYTLAPEAKMTRIVAEARAGVLWVLRNIARYGGDPDNITVSGHSAGAHLLANCIAMDWQSQGFKICPLSGAALVSGIYDLRPLVSTYINDALGLDVPSAVAASPLLHLPQSACPMAFSVGENETNAFKKQTSDYRAALRAKGMDSTFIAMPGFNHFDVVLELANAQSALFEAVMERMGRS